GTHPLQMTCLSGKSFGENRALPSLPTRRSSDLHLTAVLQPADRTLYRVPTPDPRRPLISFPPPLPHPRTCLLATGKIPPHPSAHSARHSSPQNGGPKGKMIGSAQAPRRPLSCVPIPTPAARPGRHAFPSVRRRFVIVCTC